MINKGELDKQDLNRKLIVANNEIQKLLKDIENKELKIKDWIKDYYFEKGRAERAIEAKESALLDKSYAEEISTTHIETVKDLRR